MRSGWRRRRRSRSAPASAAKHNILFKDAATLEGVSEIEAIVLDKTGTLTEGKPRVTDVVAARWIRRDELLRLAAAAEARQRAPAWPGHRRRSRASAACTLTDSDGVRAPSPGTASEPPSTDGGVLSATAQLAWSDSSIDVASTALSERRPARSSEGKTPMYVAVDGELAGVVAVADTIKPNARASHRALQGASASSR